MFHKKTSLLVAALLAVYTCIIVHYVKESTTISQQYSLTTINPIDLQQVTKMMPVEPGGLGHFAATCMYKLSPSGLSRKTKTY